MCTLLSAPLPFTDLFRRTRYDASAFGAPSVLQQRWIRLSNSGLYRSAVLAMSWAYLGFSFLEAPATSSVGEYHVAVGLNFLAAITLLLHSTVSMYWRFRLDGRLIRRFLLQVGAAPGCGVCGG